MTLFLRVGFQDWEINYILCMLSLNRDILIHGLLLKCIYLLSIALSLSTSLSLYHFLQFLIVINELLSSEINCILCMLCLNLNILIHGLLLKCIYLLSITLSLSSSLALYCFFAISYCYKWTLILRNKLHSLRFKFEPGHFDTRISLEMHSFIAYHTLLIYEVYIYIIFCYFLLLQMNLYLKR